MRVKARLLYHYKGLTWHALKEMDYREYFGFVRELSFILEEEAEANNTEPKSKNPKGEIQAALNQFPQPQPYEGETIPLI